MSVPKVIAGVVFNVTFFALLLFVPACTLHWWRAWVFLAVTLIVMTGAVLSILPDSADLFSQRARGIIQKGQPVWDRVLVILLVISYVGQIVFIPLDVFRFHLAPKPGQVVSLLGLALYVAGWWILTLPMKANPFAVPVVRLQKERRQSHRYRYLCRRAASHVCGVCPDGCGSGPLAGIICCGFGGDSSGANISLKEKRKSRQNFRLATSGN